MSAIYIDIYIYSLYNKKIYAFSIYMYVPSTAKKKKKKKNGTPQWCLFVTSDATHTRF